MARKDDDGSGPLPTPSPRPRPQPKPSPTRPPRRPTPTRPPIPTRPAPPMQEIPPAFDHDRWDRLHDEQLDIDARDPSGHFIGTARAVRAAGPVEIGGWKPLDRVKRGLVGEFDHYGFYNPGRTDAGGWVDADEADFNIFITPDPPFRHLLDDVVAKMSADEREELQKRKRGPGYCIECEITPDEEYYYDNNWFRTRKPYTAIGIGGKIGVYGPWVQDLGHKGRPEIHPCEVIWTRPSSFDGSGFNVHGFWKILVLQDDSNRFDRYSDYEGRLRARPWSASPRQAHITMSVQVPRGEHGIYNVSVDDGHRIFEHSGEEARSVSREFGPDSSLTVRKRTSRPAQVKLRVSELVPDPSDAAKLRAFLDMDIQVGDGDRGKEGFAELRIEHFVPGTSPPADDDRPPPPPTPPPPPNPPPPGTDHRDSDDPPRHEP